MDHTTCKEHHACVSFVSVHQMSPPQQLKQQTSNCSSLFIYRPRKDERLSWPSWLTYSGWLTHVSGHPSATSRAQDSESTSTKDQCSTAGPRRQMSLLTAAASGLSAACSMHVVRQQRQLCRRFVDSTCPRRDKVVTRETEEEATNRQCTCKLYFVL